MVIRVDWRRDGRTAVLQLLLSCNPPDLNADQVSNGADALRKLQAKKYGLMISDTEMPGMNGAERVYAVRADEKLKGLPVIMMLAVGAGKQEVLDAVALGISGLVIKPFKPDPLRI